MKKHYSILVPKPCHEDWNEMTPKEKGRFCDSCAKTVIDFTKMETYEIQDFINENKNNRICGHFKQTQLDSINLHIPSQVLIQQQGFHKMFLLALLIAMGTTLMNCTNKQGNKQKIDSVEVVDSINNQIIDVLGGIEKDTLQETIYSTICPKPNKPPEIVTTGEIIEVIGFVVPEINTNEPIPYTLVDTPPEFKNTPQNLSAKKKRDYFSKKISDFVQENFNIETTINLGLSGKQRIYVQFKIDSLGYVKNIRTRAPHPQFEKEAKRVIQLLPQFKPAKQTNKEVSVIYNLPIIFQIEE